MSLEHNDKIHWIEIEKIKEHPKNRNIHPDDQIKRLAESIRYQGFRSPLVISKRSGFLVKGHGALKAAKLNEMTTVPVSFQDFEDDAQEYAYITSDNALASWSHLDFSGINMDIQELGPDFNIDLLGIKNFEVDAADVKKVNKGDENSEWVGMPEFEEGEKTHKAILCFATEEERESYIESLGLTVDRRMNNQWIIYLK